MGYPKGGIPVVTSKLLLARLDHMSLVVLTAKRDQEVLCRNVICRQGDRAVIALALAGWTHIPQNGKAGKVRPLSKILLVSGERRRRIKVARCLMTP